MMRLFGFGIFLIISLLPVVTSQRVCRRDLSQVEANRQCRKICISDEDCKGSLKKCRCDDACGMSCFNPVAACDELEPILNGNIVGNRTYGETINYFCDAGYVLEGRTTRRCRSDRKWSGTAPICRAGCPHPRRTSSAFPETSEDFFHRGSVVAYVCRFGFFLTGNPNITCQSNGWSQMDFLCSKVSCGEPEEPMNGYKVGDSYLFGTKVYFYCDIGYNLGQRQNFISCSTDGTWRGNVPTCEIISCPAPLPPDGGSVDDRGVEYTYGSRVRYGCPPSYKLNGNEFGNCNENQTWGEVPTCVVDKDCEFDDPRRPICGFQNLGLRWNRILVSVGANGRRGFVMEAMFKKSQRRGEASLLSPRIPRESSLCLTFHYFMENISPGTKLILSTVDESGQRQTIWSLNRKEAANTWLSLDHFFPSLNRDLQVEFTARSSSSSGLLHLDDVSFSNDSPCVDECRSDPCLNGGSCINRINQFSCICLHGYEGTRCDIRIECSVPNPPTFGSVSVTPSTRVLLGRSITYTCNSGYSMIGNPSGQLTTTCQQNRRWADDVPKCQENTCIVQAPPLHGASSVGADTRISVNELVHYSCNHGYTLVGQPTLFCHNGGRWSNNVPQCVVRRCTNIGRDCHLPFTYRGRIYTSCISGFLFSSWCSLTDNYDNDGQWAYCDTCRNGWALWGGWDSCSLECGGGEQARRRSCQGNHPDSSDCMGSAIEKRNCNTHRCIDGGIRIGNKVYKVVKTYRKFGRARQSCRDMNGDLAVLKREEVHNSVVAEIRKQKYRSASSFFIGMTGQDKRNWMWFDGSRVILRNDEGFQRWNYRQPDDYLSNEKCGTITRQGLWNDLPCSASLYYICEFDVDPCGSSPCLNGGSCIKTLQSFTCTCEPPYTGPTCNDVVRCVRPRISSLVIIAGEYVERYIEGTTIYFACADRDKDLNGRRNITCTHEGSWSHNPPSSCIFNPCSSSPCLNGGTCHRTGSRYLCVCLDHTRGSNCEIASDPCATSPCRNAGICSSNGNSYSCQCVDLWSGPTCNEASQRCPAIAQPPNSDMRQLGGIFYLPGSYAIFDCHDGYRLIGSNVISCESNYRWSDPAPRCEARGCKIFEPSIPHGVQISELTGFEYNVGETLTASCRRNGETLNQPSTLTCRAGNVWEPNILNYRCS